MLSHKQELCADGFLKLKRRCPGCASTAFYPPATRAGSKGKLYVRCKFHKCHRRCNVTDFSIFKGTRLSLPQLARVILFYCRAKLHKAPLVSDCQSHLKMPRWAVENVFRALLYQEYKATGVAINVMYLLVIIFLILIVFSSLPIFPSLLVRFRYRNLPYHVSYADFYSDYS